MSSLVARVTAAAGAAVLVLAALAGCSSGAGTANGDAAGSVPSSRSSDAAGGDAAPKDAEDAADADDAADANDANDAADAQGAPDAGGEAADGQGSVTVEIASGPHAGTHTRSGSLQCASIGDGKWVVFAPGEGDAEDVAHLTVYWMDPGIDRSVVDTPYPDTSQLLEMKFGNVLARGDDQITISHETGGTVDTAPPTFDESGRPIYHFTATTADGVDLTISAAPFACPPY